MSTSQSNHPISTSSSERTTRKRRVPDVTEARSRAQRAKLDAQAQTRQDIPSEPPERTKGKKTPQERQGKRRTLTTVARAIDDYLQDHEGGNHSPKTVE